ncbi:hypothetical protein [Arcticibacter sp. MXS-1]|uniref:hypothetical protein n=1 Tax=Arcticibacter sp. MXS-1 TaxID=3341726 RepID=UPI0035A91111
MKTDYDLIIVIPVGPNCKVEFIEDTINSIKYYCHCTYKILISDDSQKRTGDTIKEIFPEIDLLRHKKTHGLHGGLYITLSLAFKYVLDHYSFQLLLRMDTDALITGFNPQDEAIKLFKNSPKTGIAGVYRKSKNPVDSFGNVIDNEWLRNQIVALAFTRRLLRQPIANYTLRKILIDAFKNGYDIGENVFGGAYFVSELFLRKLDEAGLLPESKLAAVVLEEDHIFGILAKSIKFDLGDLESGSLPFGCAWRGLPASPEVLWEQGKKIIHSTRFWQDLKEPEIRQFFREKRIKEGAQTMSDRINSGTVE